MLLFVFIRRELAEERFSSHTVKPSPPEILGSGRKQNIAYIGGSDMKIVAISINLTNRLNETEAIVCRLYGGFLFLKYPDVQLIERSQQLSCAARSWQNYFSHIYRVLIFTVKPVLNGNSKKDKTKVLKTNGSLMKVESIAECSLGAFCNTFDLHQAIIGLENQILVFFLRSRLRQVLLYSYYGLSGIPHRPGLGV